MRPGTCEIIDLKDLRVTPQSLRLRKIIIVVSICYILIFTPFLVYVVCDYSMSDIKSLDTMAVSNKTMACPKEPEKRPGRRLFKPRKNIQLQVQTPTHKSTAAAPNKYEILERVRQSEDVTAKVFDVPTGGTVENTDGPFTILVPRAHKVDLHVGRTPSASEMRKFVNIQRRNRQLFANLPVKLARQEGAVSNVTNWVPRKVDEQSVTGEQLSTTESKTTVKATRVRNLDLLPARRRFDRLHPVHLPQNTTFEDIRKIKAERLKRRLMKYRSRAKLNENPRMGNTGRIDIGYQEWEKNRIPEQLFGEQRRGRRKPNEDSNEVMSLSEFFNNRWASLKTNLKPRRRGRNENLRGQPEHRRQLIVDYLKSVVNDSADRSQMAKVREFPVDLAPEDWPRKGEMTTTWTTRARYHDFMHSYLKPRGKDWDFYVPLKSDEEKTWEDDMREKAFYSPQPLSDLPWSEADMPVVLTSRAEEGGEKSSENIFADTNGTSGINDGIFVKGAGEKKEGRSTDDTSRPTVAGSVPRGTKGSVARQDKTRSTVGSGTGGIDVEESSTSGITETARFRAYPSIRTGMIAGSALGQNTSSGTQRALSELMLSANDTVTVVQKGGMSTESVTGADPASLVNGTNEAILLNDKSPALDVNSTDLALPVNTTSPTVNGTNATYVVSSTSSMPGTNVSDTTYVNGARVRGKGLLANGDIPISYSPSAAEATFSISSGAADDQVVTNVSGNETRETLATQAMVRRSTGENVTYEHAFDSSAAVNASGHVVVLESSTQAVNTSNGANLDSTDVTKIKYSTTVDVPMTASNLGTAPQRVSNESAAASLIPASELSGINQGRKGKLASEQKNVLNLDTLEVSVKGGRPDLNSNATSLKTESNSKAQTQATRPSPVNPVQNAKTTETTKRLLTTGLRTNGNTTTSHKVITAVTGKPTKTHLSKKPSKSRGRLNAEKSDSSPVAEASEASISTAPTTQEELSSFSLHESRSSATAHKTKGPYSIKSLASEVPVTVIPTGHIMDKDTPEIARKTARSTTERILSTETERTSTLTNEATQSPQSSGITRSPKDSQSSTASGSTVVRKTTKHSLNITPLSDTGEEDNEFRFPVRRINRVTKTSQAPRQVGIFDLFARAGSKHGSHRRRKTAEHSTTVSSGLAKPVEMTLFGGGFYARTVDAVRISVRRGKKILRD